MRRKKDALFAVINIGNSYITGMLARKDSSGKVIPIVHCTQESGDSIKLGKIFNEDEVKTCISAIVDELSLHIGEDYSISSVYLGIEPLGMRLRQHSITHTEAEEKRYKVSRDLINSMRAEVSERVEEGYIAIHTASPRIAVDNKAIEVSRIEGQVYHKLFTLTFPTIEVEQDVLEQFAEIFSDLKLEIKGYIPTPIAEAQTSLSSADLSVGSAYVNIGGGSTSITIYRNSHLQGLYILPLGGHNLTRDLMSYKLTSVEAEAIKREYGLQRGDEQEAQVIDINGSSGRGNKSVKLRDVIECCQARMIEILENARHVIKQAGGEDLITEGYVYFSGGATRLKGLEDELQELCMIRDEYLGEYLEDDVRFAQSSVLSLAYYAEETCLKEVVLDMDSLSEDPAPTPPTRSATEHEAPAQPSLAEQVREVQLSSREETEEEKRLEKKKKQGKSFWGRTRESFSQKMGGIMNNFSNSSETASDDDNSDEED